MLSTFRICAVAAAMALSPFAAAAAPTPASARAHEPVTASLVFDPPLGQKLRYRFEKAEEGAKGKQMVWSISSFTFAKDGDGHRLTVTPEPSGYGDLERMASPAAKAVLELSKRPYTLLVSADAEIVGMENADEYWDAGIRAFTAIAAEAKPADKAIVDGIAGMMRSIPDEVKLNMLTENVMPLVEFANTETVAGEPLVTELEQPVPFGGTVKRDVTISLAEVTDGTAHIAVHSSIRARR